MWMDNSNSSNNFDLNISNYKKSELEDIFELPSKYDRAIIEAKETKLRENIFSDNSINDTTRSKTIAFLQEAKKILILNVSVSPSNPTIAQAVPPVTSEAFPGSILLKQSTLTSENGSAFLIEKPDTTFSNSFPSEFYQGTINPLKKRTTRQYLNIDTRFRENYYSTQSTNYHFDLPIKFSNVMTMQLTAFEFPNVCYAISRQLGNNFFTLTLTLNDTTTVSTVITISSGNYTPAAIITYLNNYMATVASLVSSQFTHVLFSVNSDSTHSGTGQMVVNVDTASSNINTITINFQADKSGNPDYNTPLPLKLGWMFGFREGIYINNTTYVSEGLVDLSGSRYIYLVVDDYNNNVNNSFYSAFNASILNKNILARISILGTALNNAVVFNTLAQNNLNVLSNIRYYFGPVDIQKLNIQLLDEYGRIIDLNNMDYSFCITFQSVYDL
jgi:hypothetical protein